MNKLKKTINMFLAIVLFTIIPIVVFTLATSNTSFIKGFQSFVVLSGSMQPTIPTGSVIYTKTEPLYQKGDVVAFKNGDVTVTHRIVETTNEGFITRGDANNSNDEKIITGSDILGKQMIFIPYIGRIIMFLKTPKGFFPLVVFPIVFFVVLEIWNLKKEIERQIEKKIRSRLMANDL